MTRHARIVPLLMWWSPVKYVFPAFVAIDVAALMSRGAQWRGVWASTIDWAGGAMLLLGPVLAGVAAWRAVACKSGLGEAFDLGGRGRAAQRSEAMAVVAWAWLAHLVTLLVAAAISASAGARGVPDLVPLFPQFFILLGYTALGFVAGNVMPNPLVAPLVAVVTLYLVAQFSAGSVGELWVSVGGATVTLAGSHYSRSVLTAQTVLGAAAALLVLAVHRTSLGRLEVQPLMAVTAVVPLVATAAWLGGGPPQYAKNADPPELSCTGNVPRVCVLPGREKAAATLHSFWSQELSVVRDVMPTDVPAEMDQLDSSTPLPKGHRAFDLEAIEAADGGIDPLSATFYLVIDRRCMGGSAPPPAQAIHRLQLAADYLLLRSKVETPAQVGSTEAAQVAALPLAAQRSWLAKVLQASRRCAFGDVPAPPSNG